MHNQTTFILGAGDPEMELVEKIARALPRTRVLYAAIDGQRVRPFQAYKATELIDETGQVVEPPKSGYVVLVETELPGADFGQAEVHTADHHRPGDPGFGRPPEQYFEASSLGQVVRHVEMLGLARPGDLPVDEDDLLMAAAADHCLPHAYRGRCPGVIPERLMRWRAKTRAAFQRRPVEQILSDVEQTSRLVERLVKEGDRVIELGGEAVLDLRPGLDEIHCAAHEACPGDRFDCYTVSLPELPEASVRLGVPVLATPSPGPRGRPGKVNLLGAPPATVEAFLRGEGPAAELVDLYGDPARGFAGGYRKE